MFLDGIDVQYMRGSTDKRKLLKIVRDNLQLCRDLGGNLYYYKHGRYWHHGDQAIAELVLKQHVFNDEENRWSARLSADIIHAFRIESPLLWESPPIDRINLLNGIFNIRTGELEPHTPDFLSLTQLNVEYDPGSECPRWNQFIEEVFPPDAIKLAWQIAAWLMIPYRGIHKAIVLIGDGANGKSLFLEGLTAFLGADNVSSFNLQDIEERTFISSGLMGKLANICSELPGRSLKTTNKFKTIVSGEKLAAESKFKDAFHFTPFCRLVFSTNFLPDTTDESEGWYRRLIIVPFPNTFVANPRKHRDIENALMDSGERSGLLNKALSFLPQVLEDGILLPYSVDSALLTYRKDPLACWVRDCTMLTDPKWFTSTKDLWLDAKNYFAENDHEWTYGDNSGPFVKALRKIRPELKFWRNKDNSVRGYKGIALKLDAFGNTQ